MNEADVLSLLKKRAKAEKQVYLAADLEISPAYLSDILAGKRGFGDKVITALGLEQIVTYRKVRK